jgi:hypothetical protein
MKNLVINDGKGGRNKNITAVSINLIFCFAQFARCSSVFYIENNTWCAETPDLFRVLN